MDICPIRPSTKQDKVHQRQSMTYKQELGEIYSPKHFSFALNHFLNEDRENYLGTANLSGGPRGRPIQGP